VTSSTTEPRPQVLVDPHFALEARDVGDFLAEFGPFNGRYVPRYPSDWSARLRAHLEDLSVSNPVKRKAMEERLRSEAYLCTVPVGWKWQSERSWRWNVEQQSPAKENQLVVGDAVDPEPFRAWPDALEEIRETRRRSWPFHGSVDEYLDACTPLLINSPTAYLIDPYLDPFSEVGEVLLGAVFAAVKGSRCYSIQIITRRSACGSRGRPEDAPPMSDEGIQSQLDMIYGDALPKDREMRLHLVSEGRAGERWLRLHDRFFLTTHGAINFGQGFFVLKQPLPQQNAFVLDKGHHMVLKCTYIDGVARWNECLPRLPGVAYPKDVNSFKLQSVSPSLQKSSITS
jgi:hypothetical protein